jgi:hypothetical protein
MSELLQAVCRFLDENFPGSRIDDGYYFIAIREGAAAPIRHDHRQRLANRIGERRCLLVSVGIDPRPLLRTNRVEERTVEYNPDWDVHVPRPQWLVDLPPQRIDVRALLSAGTEPCALALIDPERRIVLDLYLRTVHAPTRAVLDSFLVGFEDAVERTSS